MKKSNKEGSSVVTVAKFPRLEVRNKKYSGFILKYHDTMALREDSKGCFLDFDYDIVDRPTGMRKRTCDSVAKGILRQVLYASADMAPPKGMERITFNILKD